MFPGHFSKTPDDDLTHDMRRNATLPTTRVQRIAGPVESEQMISAGQARAASLPTYPWTPPFMRGPPVGQVWSMDESSRQRPHIITGGAPLPNASAIVHTSMRSPFSTNAAQIDSSWQSKAVGALQSSGQATHYYDEPALVEPNVSPSGSHQRKLSSRDEFDGPSQYLDKPQHAEQEPTERDLPQLPIHLHPQEQDDILGQVNDRLSRCAFDFVARYQFPIPIEPDKRPVRVPGDREWSEWVYLLKRLATKRRIPSRVLFNGQIKQLITILEGSLEMRHAAKHQSRPLKDDRNVLQLISSGLQVAKILKDATAMRYLDNLYVQTERTINTRCGSPRNRSPSYADS